MTIESEDFYILMQEYRQSNTTHTNPIATANAYKAVIVHVDTEVAALRENAERYLHLRNTGMIVASFTGKGIAFPMYGDVSHNEKLELDALLDKSIQQSKSSAQGGK